MLEKIRGEEINESFNNFFSIFFLIVFFQIVLMLILFLFFKIVDISKCDKSFLVKFILFPASAINSKDSLRFLVNSNFNFYLCINPFLTKFKKLIWVNCNLCCSKICEI